MPALQVRDFPPALYDDLKRCAEREHRSIAQQTIALVDESLRMRKELQQTREQFAPSPQKAPLWISHRETKAQKAARLQKREEIFKDLFESPVTLSPDAPRPVDAVRESREERSQELEFNAFSEQGASL